MFNKYRRVINTRIPGSQPQINANTAKSSQHTTSIAVDTRVHVSGSDYSNNPPVMSPFSTSGNAIDNLYRALAAGATPPSIPAGRTITFNNNTASTNLDLYLTVGGTNPQPIALISSNISFGGGSHVWPIPDDIYGWNGNFTTMPAGVSPPQYNAGPTIAEFGLNQYWHGATPPLRDTIDISTVPSGIGTSVNNGPRSAAVAASRAVGFSVQQSYNYNVGVQIVPPVGGGIVLPQAVTVTCINTNGDCAQSIGYPNDTANPKQQTRDAIGNYIINFIDPVVSL